jgi:ABC-2 type transport system ATP-binding protein
LILFYRDELRDVFLMLKERGVAILFSTHNTSDLEKCADDIL